MKQKLVQDGVWYEIPWRGHRVACCDCLLAHILDFRRKGKKLFIRYWRDNKSTAAARAWCRRKAK